MLNVVIELAEIITLTPSSIINFNEYLCKIFIDKNRIFCILL